MKFTSIGYRLFKYLRKAVVCMMFFFGIMSVSEGQTSLKWEVDKKAGKAIYDDVPAGKALLIFDSPVNLEFDSSIENIDQPKRKNGKYFLFVSDGPQAISINYLGNYTINFGQLMDPNSLPALKNGEIKYFRITIRQELEYYDITEKEKAKGNIAIPVGKNVSDALVVLNIFPPDMDIIVSDKKNNITKLSKEKGSYKVFLTAPGSHELEVFQSEIGSTIIEIKNLETKETRFYLIRKPITLNDYKEKPASSKYDLKKKLVGYWGGNIGKEETYIDIKKINFGKLSGRIYIDGIYHDISGVVKIKSNNEFYITANMLKSELNNEKGTLDFIVKMGVGSGIYISGNGNVSDFNMLRVSKIPEKKSQTEISDFRKLQSRIEGKWLSEKVAIIKSVEVKKISIERKVSGIITFNNDRQCAFHGNYTKRKETISLMLNITSDCSKNAGVMIYTHNNNKIKGMYTSNDGSIMENCSFKRK